MSEHDKFVSGAGASADDEAETTRREALVKVGRYAGLMAPAVVTLLTTDAAAVWAGSGPVNPPGRPRPPKPPKRPRRP